MSTAYTTASRTSNDTDEQVKGFRILAEVCQNNREDARSIQFHDCFSGYVFCLAAAGEFRANSIAVQKSPRPNAGAEGNARGY